MNHSTRLFGLVIVGSGPAGIAPLLAAHRMGQLDALLASGIVLVEQSDRIGSGSIGGYAINSDSSGRTFVDCLLGDDETELTRLEQHSLTQVLAAAGDGAVSLRDAGRFLGLVGEAICRMVLEHPASAVLTNHRAIATQRVQGGWCVQVRDLATGEKRTLASHNVVIATGAHQPPDRLAAEQVGGSRLVDRCADRLLQSGDVLATGGLERVANLLAGKARPRVAVIGGSTSAAAVAHALLHRLPQVRFGHAGITLLHRRELRIYYPDRASGSIGADSKTESLHLLVNSPKLKLCGAGEWLQEKHRTNTRRSWRKMHLVLDAGTAQIVATRLANHDADDASQVEPLLDQVAGSLACTGDGAYDQDGVTASVAKRLPEAAVVVPPCSTAVPSKAAETGSTQRGSHLQPIAEKDRTRWQKVSGYTKRARAEAAMARFKQMIGDGLRLRTHESWAVEVDVAVHVLNRMLDWVARATSASHDPIMGLGQCA